MNRAMNTNEALARIIKITHSLCPLLASRLLSPEKVRRAGTLAVGRKDEDESDLNSRLNVERRDAKRDRQGKKCHGEK